METCEARPWPGTPPPLGADVETTEWLLEIAKWRLLNAVKMETDRNIVYPETTVISRDVQRLMKRVRALQSAEIDVEGDGDGDTDTDVDPEADADTKTEAKTEAEAVTPKRRKPRNKWGILGDDDDFDFDI